MGKPVKNEENYKFEINNLNLHYGDFHALKNINMNIEKNQITAFIGPSGCGKSTFLKTLNRMNDLVDGVKIDGNVYLDGKDIFADMDAINLRHRVGMVFQQPNPFPKSIYDNIAYGPRLFGVKKKSELDIIVEKSLKQAAIWDEVKDRLKKSALGLSGGQQQRLCIARTLAVEPEVILMDEPTSALDPISTSRIEDLAVELKNNYTIIMVTHNMQQAARISDNTALEELNEEIIEMGKMIVYDIQNAVKALVTQDINLAKEAIQYDSSIDRQERNIEHLCLKLLLEQQPVAGDLRIISSALKMITDMERIGDHAADISELTILMAKESYIKHLEHIQLMAEISMTMLSESLDAYVEKDLKKAEAVIKRDDEVDDLFDKVKNELINIIHENVNDGEQAANLLMAAKYMERIGDHATNISEWVIFSITGKHEEEQ